MFNFRLVSIIALFAGPIIIYMNFKETSEKQKIDKEGIVTVATPTKKWENTGRKGGKTYKLDIEFPLEGGSTKSAQIKISKDLFDHVEEKPMLKIKYLKEDSNQILVDGEPITSPEMYYAGAGVFFLGLIGCWFYFLRKR